MKRRPRIGQRETVNAFTLDAEARGGANPTSDSAHEKYEPPEGYILIDYKEHVHVNRGNATVNIGTQPAGYRIINSNHVKGNLDAHVEWRYAKVWGTGDLITKWQNIRTKIQEYQRLRRRIVGKAKAKGEFLGAGAHIRVQVRATIEYVGTAADANQYSNLILRNFSSDGHIKYLSSNWRASRRNVVSRMVRHSRKGWDYTIYIYNINPTTRTNQVSYNTATRKPGVYKFKPVLKTEGVRRSVIIRIQEDFNGRIIGKNEKRITLYNRSRAYEINYTRKRSDSKLFYIIKWNDRRRDKIILYGKRTFVVVPN